MDDTNGGVMSWLSEYAQWAIRLWIFQFFFSMYATCVANLVFKIPLGSAVDVQLALQIFAPITLTFLYIYNSLRARDFSDWYIFVATLPVYALTSFAAVLGYTLYGLIANVDLNATSSVYTGFMTFVRHALGALAHIGELLSIPHSRYIGSPGFFNWSQFTFGALGLALPVMQRVLQGAYHRIRQRLLGV
mgnify:CR=1 FL=1